MDTLQRNKVIGGLVAIAVVALILFGITYSNNKPALETGTASEEDMNQEETNPTVTFKTTMGDITLELYIDKMPITAGNFIKLSEQGFYTNTKFHRVIDGFMIQGGDPNSKGDDSSIYGQGGPGYTIEDEFVEGLSNVRGTISMANIGQPNSGGSQFFINLTNNIELDFDKQPETSKHPVFGQVVSGMDVVDAIARVQTGESDIPLEPIVIETVVVDEADKGSEENAEEEGNLEEEVSTTTRATGE